MDSEEKEEEKKSVAHALQSFVTQALTFYIMTDFNAPMAVEYIAYLFERMASFSIKRDGEYIGANELLEFLLGKYKQFLDGEIRASAQDATRQSRTSFLRRDPSHEAVVDEIDAIIKNIKSGKIKNDDDGGTLN